MGYILLEGGSEFMGMMADADQRAIQASGGKEAPVVILPTAAAPDNNHERAGHNGIRWFQSLGAQHVEVAAVIDKASADDPELAVRLQSARLIYLLGGFPRYLGETLQNSRVWKVALEAYANGAVIAGSSAGAMVLCEYYYDPHRKEVLPGLDLLHHCCILPHYNNFGKKWADSLRQLLPDTVLIGIDEQTGMLNEHPGEWSIYGKGGITLYDGEGRRTYERGETFHLVSS